MKIYFINATMTVNINVNIKMFRNVLTAFSLTTLSSTGVPLRNKRKQIVITKLNIKKITTKLANENHVL